MEQIDTDELNKQILEIINTKNEINLKHSEWLKNIITIAVGFVAIIVSLKNKKSTNFIEHYLYLTMLCSNVFGILCGLIALHSEVKLLNLVVKKRTQLLLNRLNKTNISPFAEIVSVKQPIVYLYISYLCYLSFIVSIISLFFYIIVSES